MTLYAATTNPGKLAEFATSASSQGIAVEALPNLAQMAEPIEDALTFMGNAEKKAAAYSLLAPNRLIFADDSGLEVPALHNQPGVRSARFADDLGFELPQKSVISTGAQHSGETPVSAPANANPGTRDARNNRCLLSLLAQLPNPSRAARFVCALALARDGKVLLRAEGTVDGELLRAPRGSAGFGYDPLFLIPHLNLTMAELSREQKWQLSHRGNAFRNLLTQLQSSASE